MRDEQSGHVIGSPPTTAHLVTLQLQAVHLGHVPAPAPGHCRASSHDMIVFAISGKYLHYSIYSYLLYIVKIF